MDDRQFEEEAEEIFVRVEDRVDELELDADIDVSGGIVTFTLVDGSQIILSRQVANHEIWVAARSGGFHLKRVDSGWHCATTNEDLDDLLGRVFEEQAGVRLFGGTDR